MALESPRLDDLTWEGMLEKVRRRIPARSDGRWTLHAPVDPGVTLLELYAWLLEQRSFMLDQTPDPLVLAELGLLGVRPSPTAAATTVLAFKSATTRVVTQNSEMELAARTPRFVFSTVRETTLLPVGDDPARAVGIRVGGVDRTSDLLSKRLVRVFPADGSAAEATFLIRTTALLTPVAPRAPLGLLVVLDPAVTLPASWDARGRRAPPPVELSWWYPSTNGTLRRFSKRGFQDGTGGFRRSGVVRLRVPRDWKPELRPSVPPSFHYPIVVRVARAIWTSPPRVALLAANAVVAAHRRRTITHQLTRDDWLPLPGRTLSLADLPPINPEKDVPPIERSVRLSLRERDGRWYGWRRTLDLTPHGPRDRVFVVDRAEGVLRFGDGYAGRQPVLAQTGAPNVRVSYWVGGGPDGNIGAGASWEKPHPTPALALSATNVVDADGGAEAQTPEEARRGASRVLTEITRAVTDSDYVALAKTTPGVAIRRAHAALGTHPCHPCQRVPGAVTVFVVPGAPRDETDGNPGDAAFVANPVADPSALAAVRTRLEAARLAGTEVFVAPAPYRPVRIVIDVRGDVGDPEELRLRLLDALQTFLDPLRGGDDENGRPFGEPVRPSALLRRAQEVVGDSGQVTAVAVALDGVAEIEGCKEKPIRDHELVYLAALELRLQRAAAVRPGLR
jgi:predicted phage baseplate assembly protein